MGAWDDCIKPNGGKMAATESTEVFAIHMSSNTSLNAPRRELESQLSKPDTSSRHSIWWKLAIDLPLLVIVLLLIGLFEIGVIPNHKAGFTCNDPGLSYPFKADTVSMGVLVASVLILPLVLVFPTELVFIRSDYLRVRFCRALRVTLWLYRSYLYGLVFNLAVIEVMKGITGSPRPSFFDTCRPDTALTCNGSEFVSTFTCTSSHSEWLQRDSYHSFPSGHTSLSVFCGLFIAWYLQSRAFDWRHRTIFVVPTLQILCFAYAVVCSLTRVTDHRHHWWDVLTGAVIGVVSLYYSVVVLCDNFSYAKLKCSNEVTIEDNQQSVKTLLFGRAQRDIAS